MYYGSPIKSESEGNTISITRVVVVRIAIVVDISRISRIPGVSREKPPIRTKENNLYSNLFSFRYSRPLPRFHLGIH